MRITEKLLTGDRKTLEAHGPVTIAALGDSVTHGALGAGEINYETVYHNRLRQMLNATRPYMPVNMINAGIGGITAKGSLARLERQVIAHAPDLVTVCFGLNDVNGAPEDFAAAMAEIFTRIKGSGAEVICMTPNMLNTYVAEGTEEIYLAYAAKTAEMQCGGRMDAFMDIARETAAAAGVPVCDCYAQWKKMYAAGEDTTLMLANRINHPTAEMHRLFADALFAQIMGKAAPVADNDSVMYR